MCGGTKAVIVSSTNGTTIVTRRVLPRPDGMSGSPLRRTSSNRPSQRSASGACKWRNTSGAGAASATDRSIRNRGVAAAALRAAVLTPASGWLVARCAWVRAQAVALSHDTPNTIHRRRCGRSRRLLDATAQRGWQKRRPTGCVAFVHTVSHGLATNSYCRAAGGFARHKPATFLRTEAVARSSLRHEFVAGLVDDLHGLGEKRCIVGLAHACEHMVGKQSDELAQLGCAPARVVDIRRA